MRLRSTLLMTLLGAICVSLYPQASTAQGTLQLSAATSPSTCGSANGTILLTASGGTPPYSYSFNQGVLPFQSSAFWKTIAGTYTVAVSDSKGQVTSTTATVGNNFPAVSLSLISSTAPTACDAADASFTLAVSGGTSPFLYSTDSVNYQPSNIISGKTAGDYSFFVKDANGCAANLFQQMPLPASCSITDFFQANAPSRYFCGNLGAISMELDIIFGGPPAYALNNDPFSPQSDYNNLPPGTYIARATDGTNNFAYSFTFFSDCAFMPASWGPTDASCGSPDGQIIAQGQGGTLPYSYSLDGVNFQPSGNFTGLAPGDYTLLMRDATGALIVLPEQVVGTPCPYLRATKTDATCAGGDGMITATAFGGTGALSYSLDGVNYQPGNDFTGLAGLPAGKPYTVFVKDGTGTTDQVLVTIYSPDCLTVSGVAGNTVCGHANGTITATPGNGTAPFSYSIDGVNFQSGTVISGLLAGSYTLTVKDGATNTATAPAPIVIANGPAAPNACVQVGLTPVSATCGNANGSITAAVPTGVFSGTAPYQYSQDGINFQASPVFANLSANNYTITVEDANGYLGSSSATVGNTSGASVLANPTPATCLNNDGSIVVSGTGGTAPYAYTLDGINYQPGGSFAALASGSYQPGIKDGNGCVTTGAAVLVAQTDNLTLNAGGPLGVCANGSVGLDAVSNATGYAWTPAAGLDDAAIAGPVASPSVTTTYTVTAKLGTCQQTASVLVTVDPTPSADAGTDTILCFGETVQLKGSGTGAGALSYAWTPSTGLSDAAIAGPVANDPGGSSTVYHLTVTDQNNCKSPDASVTVTVTPDITLDVGGPLVVCANGSVGLDAVSNATGYAWTPAAGLDNPAIAGPVASPSLTTTYTVTAKLGVCQQTASVLVTVDPTPSASAGTDTTLCSGQTVQLKGSGTGTGALSYAWAPSTGLSDAHIANPVADDPGGSSTVYHLTVTDQNNCKSVTDASVTVTVTPPGQLSAGNDTLVEANQPVQLKATDPGNSGYSSYTWSPATGLSNPDIFDPVATILQDMVYTVTAKTPAGCEAEASVSIKAFSVVDLLVPNAFTPNGDGHNDVLRIRPMGISRLNYFAVYNRWGLRVFYTTDPGMGWDGTLNGKVQDAGVYVWMAGGVDYKGRIVERKGTVILIR